jgi:type I restriction enzyme S subunit
MDSGSAIPSTSRDAFYRLPVRVPPKPEQRSIAHILGALDDKIELNRRMNETLEAIAQAIFKSWFVDFEPVRAKMAGRDPGLPKHIADLFPDRLVELELGEIPEGWMVKSLGDVSEKPQYGYTASANDELVGPKFLRITDINKRPWTEWASVPHCEIAHQDIQKYRLHQGDILVARMADPGHGVMIEEDVEAVFASYLIRFRPVDLHYCRFLQYWLRSEAYWDLVGARGAGTTRVSLNANVLSGFHMAFPPTSVADAFRSQINPLRARVVANVTETETLSTLRDALLPKLISGEIRVRDAERFLKERGL